MLREELYYTRVHFMDSLHIVQITVSVMISRKIDSYPQVSIIVNVPSALQLSHNVHSEVLQGLRKPYM